jgi:hypothetical protein
VADAFRLSVASLRDPRPFFGSAAGVRRLQIHLDDALFVLTQTNGLRFEAPVSDEADQFAVRDTVDRLLRLKADAILENGEDAQSAVHERSLPISHVELTAEQGAWRFLVVPGDLEGAVFNLVFTNAPTVYRIASSNLPPALVNMAGVFSLREKSVLSLPRASVRRIAVTREGTPAAIVERASSEALWHLGDGTAGRIVDERLQALLACVEILRADRIEGVGLASERFAPSDCASLGLRSASTSMRGMPYAKRSRSVAKPVSANGTRPYADWTCCSCLIERRWIFWTPASWSRLRHERRVSIYAVSPSPVDRTARTGQNV